MKKNKILLSIVAVISFTFIFQANAQENPDNLQGSLGGGWSSDNQGPLPSVCVDKGTITYTGVPSSSLSLNERYSYEDIKEQLNLDNGGSFTLPGFSMGGDAQFSQMIEDTNFSQAFTYRAHVKLKNRVYSAPTDRDPLTWFGRQYVKEPQKFREYCGDKFISQQELGGSLYIAIKYNFFTQKDRETFTESFNASGIGSLFDFHQKFSEVINSIKKHGHVTIIAHQIGGKPAYLGEILGTTEKGNIAVAKCSLGDIADCEKALGKALAYASQPANNGFPSQFDQDSPGANGPAVLKNIPEDYAFIVPNINTGKSFLTSEITAARQALSKAYQKNISQYNLVAGVKNNGLPYVQKSLDTLNSLLKKLQTNLTNLGTAAQACYSGDLGDCVTKEQQVTANLIAIDTAFLQKLGKFTLTIFTPHDWKLPPYQYNFYWQNVLDNANGSLLFYGIDRNGKYEHGESCLYWALVNPEGAKRRGITKLRTKFNVTPTEFSGTCSGCFGGECGYTTFKATSTNGQVYNGHITHSITNQGALKITLKKQ